MYFYNSTYRDKRDTRAMIKDKQFLGVRKLLQDGVGSMIVPKYVRHL